MDINPSDKIFSDKNITDMKDYYVIGIYSDEDRAITITVNSYA